MIRAAMLVLALAATAPAEDWPQWRGPRGDGTWRGPAIPATWPAGGPRVVWKKPIGGGYAGVAAVGGRVFTMDYDAATKTERVRCFAVADGKPLWSHDYPVKYGDLGGYANGPRAMPTVHAGRVYTLGAVGLLCCLDAESGKVVWQRDAVKELGARVPMWGYAGAPLIDGDRVIVYLGAVPNGCVVALDRLTGKELWRLVADEAGYCAPIIADAPAGRLMVVWTPNHVYGLNPATGEKYWSVPYKVTYGVAIASPVVRDGLCFVTGYWEGSKAIRLTSDPKAAEIAWEDRRDLRGLMAQPLYRGGYLYTLDKQQGLTCCELKTGKKLWDDANALTPAGRNPHASVVWLGDSNRILALNSAGDLVTAKLSPKGYAEQSRAKVLAGRAWSHPAFAGRFMYARTDGGEQWQTAGQCELVCVELVAEPK